MAYVYANPPTMTATSAKPLRGCRVRMRLGAFNYASSGPVRQLPGGIIWNSPGPGRARIPLIREVVPPTRPPLVDGVYNTPYYMYPFNPPPASQPVQSAQPLGWVWQTQYFPGQPMDMVPGLQLPAGSNAPRSSSSWQPIYNSAILASMQNSLNYAGKVSVGANKPNWTPQQTAQASSPQGSQSSPSNTQTATPAATSAAAPAATGTSLMSFVSSIPWWGWGAAAVGGFLLWKGVSK